MKKIVFLLILLFTSCAPSAPGTDIAVAQTQFAYSQTLNAAVTPTPENTHTPKPTLTPTLDIRIVTMDPQFFLLRKIDFPKDGKFYLPSFDLISLDPNDLIIANWSVTKGTEYVLSTGRVTGWSETYVRGAMAAKYPDHVDISIEKYKTVQGAQLAITKYNYVVAFPEDGWVTIDFAKKVGDISLAEEMKQISKSSYVFTRLIELSYRNIGIRISGFGRDESVSFEFLASLAEKIIRNINAAPTYSPRMVRTTTP
jgi:hypothetical protein